MPEMCRHLQLLLLLPPALVAVAHAAANETRRHGDEDVDEFDFDLGQTAAKTFWQKLLCYVAGGTSPRSHTAQDTKCSFVENKQATATTIATTIIAIAEETKQVNRTNSQRTRFMHFHFVKHF